jgi:HPt (histidine-containing phosphotransfer) domain-containing protein
VHFSCKITHGILTYLESEKVDLSAYFSEVDIPWELLRDPSYWMRAPDMEAFLERLSLKESDLIKAGHRTPKTRVWGVLDSVLRMMPKPQEIFQQPEKFLSYFISPEPPIENLRRFDSGLSFDIPLPAEQYPMVTAYLRAAFESLPVYVGQTSATCEWKDITFKIEWAEEQPSILNEAVTERNISPELMQDVIRQLQQSSRSLEEKNRELQRRNEELSLLAQTGGVQIAPAAVTPQDFSQFEFMKQPVHQVAQNLSRLHDYMVRAQQLVAIITAGQKQTAGIKEAFHRVDWEIVKNRYPQLILESLETLKKLNKPDGRSSDN